MKGLIEAIEKENLKDSVPAFNVGDTVKVSVKVVEGTRERLQAFEGVVIITVIRKGKVRRAKLYYLRGRTGKAAKIKEVR